LSALISVALYGGYARGDLRLIAKAGLLMEAYSGKILWKKNGVGRLAPASTTKILTALVAIEHSA
jgi:D-alanyl-D-alanine carboxypeptidase (penicillin-binding protein 5/6)